MTATGAPPAAARREAQVGGASPADVRAPAFIGRDREAAALAGALSEKPAVVLLEGEAGIGKTRLLQEYLASAACGRVLVTVCPPFRGPFTLAPIVDALRHARADVAALQLSALGGALRSLFPEWACDLPATLEPAEDASASRHRLFRALAELLDGLAVDTLVVEDVHWADDATLEFLLFLTSRRPQPVSLVVTYRPEDVPDRSLLWRLTSRPPTGSIQLRLVLEPLGVDETAHLVSSMLTNEHVSADFANFLHRHTDGVPLAVEESVRLMHGRADLTRRGGEWVRRRIDEIVVPPTVRDSVLERVARLCPDAQTVLRAAALLAEPATEATLVQVTGLTEERAWSGLSVALGSGLIAADARHLLSFRHILAGLAVYEAMPASDRRRMHAVAAQSLIDSTPQPLAQIARHFREAGDTAQWCRYAEETANLAITSGDEATAVTVLHDLLTKAVLPAPVLVRLLKKFPVAALSGHARFHDLVNCLRSVLDSRTLPNHESAEIRFYLGRLLLVIGEHETGRQELERAIPDASDDAVASRAMTLLGWPRGSPARAAVHRRWLERAAEVAESMAPSDRLHFIVDGATALLMLGEQAGWTQAAQIPDVAAVPQDWPLITVGHLNVGDKAMLWGWYSTAAARLQKAKRLAEEHGYLNVHNVVLVTLAHLDWFTGNWSGLAERAASLAEDADVLPVEQSEAVLVRGLLHAVAGEDERADKALQRAQTLDGEATDRTMEPAAALARLRLTHARVDDALQLTDEAISVISGKDIWVWATDIAPVRVDALIAAGRGADAADLVVTFGRRLRGCDAPAPRAALSLCRAILAEHRGDHAIAARAFARAAAAWSALPRPYDALLARERQANCLFAAGDNQHGIRTLSEVLVGFSALGVRAGAARVEQLLRGQGVQPRRSGAGRPGYGDQLSPRELDVVRLLVTGQTDRQIAEALFVSPRTVAYHLDSARRKLNVSSRTVLALRVIDAGLVGND